MYDFKTSIWKPKENIEAIIIAIHGYNDYSNSFDIPANQFKSFKIATFSYDLRGFGRNKDRGNWFPLETHVSDVNFFVKKIKEENPSIKIFLLGESMGAAIVLSAVSEIKETIDGIILVAPAIWNFSEKNPLKKFFLSISSNVFPELKLEGSNFIKVRASNNTEVLKKLAEDQFFIHKPNLKSLNGIVTLMDKSYKYAKHYIDKPKYQTLIMVPIKDEIIPRKPLAEILLDGSKETEKKITLVVFENNYHMLLRDLENKKISKVIVDWINKERDFLSFPKSVDFLKNSKFYHILER